MKKLFIRTLFALALCIPNLILAQTLKFAVTDIAGLEELQRDFKDFESKLADFTGVELKFYPVSNRNVVIEAMKRGQIDLVLAGPAEYVVIKKRVGAVPIVTLSRDHYNSAIIVRSDSGIDAIDSLKGKKIGFGDVGSTSYHLAPMQILKDSGLDPVKDIQAIHVNKHVAWKSLVRGDLPAIGMNYERYLFFLSKDSTVKESELKVLKTGPDLPGDVLMAREGLSTELVEKVRKAFVDHGDEMLTAILKGERNNKYEGMKFKASVKDSDYDYIRKMYATAGFPEYSEFIGES